MSVAATFDIAAGVGSLVCTAGANTVSMGGTTVPTFSASGGDTFDIGAGASGSWSGTTTITEDTPNSITDGVDITLGDGRPFNLNRTGGTSTGIAGTVAFTSSGTNTLSIGGAGGNPAIIVNDVSIETTGGTLAVTFAMSKLAAALSNAVVGPTTITGVIGATQNKTITYGDSGGSVTSFSITGQNTAGPNVWTLDSPNAIALNTGANSQAKTVKVKSAGAAVTITGASSGASTIQIGTVAGAAAGLDAIDATVGITGSGQTTNNIRIDDSGSATGDKTYTITPATGQTSDSTVACSSFSTISYKTQGSGTWAGGLRFDGSDEGGCTFAIVRNFLDNAVIAGGGGNTNTLDLSSLSGYSVADEGDGTGVVTLSNSKTITYSGIGTHVPELPPENTVAPSCSPTSGTVADEFVFDSGTWTGDPDEWSWEYSADDPVDWVEFSTSQNPTVEGSTFGVGEWKTRLTATNAGGPSSPVLGSEIAVTAEPSGGGSKLTLTGCS